jgi:hypothetical protein
MNAQSIEIVRQPETLIWYGTPSDHSGAYHTILSVGLDGIPIEVSIENPDNFRLEIPGLLDSGWDPELEEVVAEFFEAAPTCRPTKGVFFNQERINTITDLAEQFHSLSPAIESFFHEPSQTSPSIDSFEGALLIYSRIANHVESKLYQTYVYSKDKDVIKQLGVRLSTIKQYMTSGSDPDGFIQFITDEDWLSVSKLVDIFSWWLWDSSRIIHRINDG